MKRFALLVLSFLLLAVCGCGGEKTAMGFVPDHFTVVEESDSHGGWMGDGLYYLVLDCAGNRDEALENVSGWKELPLSENLRLMVYGGEKAGMRYSYLEKEVSIPQMEEGWYYFVDRHRESTDSSDDTNLLSRFSFNFSLAVYDAATDRLYYLEFDT